jgi:hypothetical protein
MGRQGGRSGREGLMEREGMERGENGGGEGRGIWTPDLPDTSTPVTARYLQGPPSPGSAIPRVRHPQDPPLTGIERR